MSLQRRHEHHRLGSVARRYLVRGGGGRIALEFRYSLISSRFQGLAHRRPVGYEGLIRGTDSNGKGYLATNCLQRRQRRAAHAARSQCRALHVPEFPAAGR